MQLWTESVELLETHDERPPLVRVDPVVLPGHQNRLFQMHALNAHLDDENSPALCRIMLRQVMETLDLRFELDRTAGNDPESQRAALGGYTREAAIRPKHRGTGNRPRNRARQAAAYLLVIFVS